MSDTQILIINFSQISSHAIKIVGSKAANLSILLNNGFHIPEGFVVTTNAYEEFLKANNLAVLESMRLMIS